ncbi:NIF domain [Cordyceps militaris]|uniref:Mitochondrial import inner membrane translocase subunit TIM50 n=1 Tax=Cordyceps militaris TaxID=73501 RepID=A0A2H4STN9_CORMI|nr:NIF domain [Cordyceps militaris]
MATQEMVVVSQQSMQVATAPTAPVKAKAGKVPPWKQRKQKKLLPASAVTESSTTVQSTETKSSQAKKNKKQKKAKGEAAEAAAGLENGVELSQVLQVTETIESKMENDALVQDKVTVPSPESGGVPEPTKAYLRCASLAPSRLARPRRILIVMDLNGTLLHRPNKRRPSVFVDRPHARVFMEYLLTHFAVAVWSSARPENVHLMLASLLTPAQRARCAVVWGRDHFGLSRADYNSRVQCYKRLARVWADPGVMAAHPDARRGGCWDQSNTVLVDDSAEKARSEPHNLLRIPEYAGRAAAEDCLFVLPQVHDYINELAHQADISRFIRETPFQLDPSYKL